MSNKNKALFIFLILIDAALVGLCLAMILRPDVHFGNAGFFNPQGIIALKQRNLLVTAFLIMMIAVVPVYLLLFFFVWKYRADKPTGKYSPDSQSSLKWTLALWAIPVAIIFVISILNWKSAHDLDPTDPIASNNPPITIEVVALQWKWLFIYPEQNIATVNFVEFPVNTPVHFELTADAPMSAFWIPQLGSQIYAMAAMQTQMNLMANQTGDFPGKNTEINGAGFSGMNFIARSVTQPDFDSWVKSTQLANNQLSSNVYNRLALPSENNPETLYSSVDQNLYNSVMMKYMMPATASETPSSMTMPGMEH